VAKVYLQHAPRKTTSVFYAQQLMEGMPKGKDSDAALFEQQHLGQEEQRKTGASKAKLPGDEGALLPSDCRVC
jgi:hypothetical protein